MPLSTKALVSAVALSLLVCSRSFLVKLSTTDGEYSYNPVSVVLMTELFKLISATAMYKSDAAQRGSSIVREFDQKVALLYVVPAILYAVQNNIVFVALRYLDAPTFELFSNLKSVTTSVVSYFLLRKQFTMLQWAAVLLLCVGSTLGQLQNQYTQTITSALASDSEQALEESGLEWGQMIGAGACLAYSFLSAFAGVYTEKLIKGSQQPLALQNMEIYAWSVGANFALAMYQNSSLLLNGEFFNGFGPMTWILIINGAAMGQCVSFVMKYADNIIKVFAAAMAMFLSTFLSMVFFAFQPGLLLMLGFVVTCVALFLYLGPHNDLIKLEWEAIKRRNSPPVNKVSSASINPV